MLGRVCHVTARLTIVILICNGLPAGATSEETQRSPEWFNAKNTWKLQQLSKQQTRQISNLVSLRRLMENILPYLLYPRPPGSPGNTYARRTITTIMRDVLKWDVQYDTFVASTPRPYRSTSFSNIIATYDTSARRRLVLACHYDSKVRPRNFVGATDSAVPCSIMMEIAVALRNYLESAKGNLTLQLIFFDGEEALVRWSKTDSLYGSRHLAQLWQDTSWPENQTTTDRNKLNSIDLLTVLDLLGASNLKFYNTRVVKSKHFEDLIRIEKLMFGTNEYFQQDLLPTFVEDDHIPFYLRNVSVLHVIPDPFPRQWHTLMDNAMNLDNSSIKKLADIFAVFVAEYLHLNV